MFHFFLQICLFVAGYQATPQANENGKTRVSHSAKQQLEGNTQAALTPNSL